MIKKTLSLYDFENEWSKWEDRKDTFSYEGKKALFEYLEQLSDDIGEDIELDIVGLCCEYSEYDNALECAREHGYVIETDLDDEDDKEERALEWLQERTQVVGIWNETYLGGNTAKGIIIQQF